MIKDSTVDFGGYRTSLVKHKYDENNKRVESMYDSFSWKYGNGDTAYVFYDEHENANHIKMGNGKEFIWELKYDENGNVVYMKSPDGRISTYEYIEKPFIISE